MRIKGALRLSAATGLALALGAGVSSASVAQTANAQTADSSIPPMPLHSALDRLAHNSGIELVYTSNVAEGIQSGGAPAGLPPEQTLSRLLRGTGLTYQRNDGAYMILAANASRPAAPTTIETVTVTAQKVQEDIQNVPIAVSAFSQKELTARQIATGGDLIRETPNMNFSKTNFAGYNIEIRGIGTQAVSVTTDPAVAVAFNDIPFLRNHFFEQEFYDLADAEVLRGPQGTLWGRNATAGLVNLKSALPTDQFEAMASLDFGNFNGRRMEAMINLPIVGDKLDIRFAGEWTKRDGYTFDTTTNSTVDGRDLWSGRVTIGWKPTEDLQTYLVWEHYSEDDNRLRSGKVLCTTDPGPSVVNGPAGPQIPQSTSFQAPTAPWLTQGCLPGSLYSPAAFGVPNPLSIPFVQATEYLNVSMPTGFNPYGTLSQSQDLRVIGSSLLPRYAAKNDTLEFNAIYQVTPTLTLTSQTGYSKDFLYSTEDYNRFNTVPNAFEPNAFNGVDGQYCDPQLGCSTQFLAEDVSQEHAEQMYQEVRLASNFAGPLNFNAGANYLHYDTIEDYYVFSNLLSVFQEAINGVRWTYGPHVPFDPVAANACDPQPATANLNFATTFLGLGCAYVDPNPLRQIDGQGHNYFRSQNPYHLNSLAGFGEAYYQVTPDVKLTGGLRFTDDMKSFTEIPSWTLLTGKGYPVTGVLKQQWQEVTGRLNATWTPTLDFTDQSLFYGSYSRGYKAGGANPPGVMPFAFADIKFESPSNYTHPLTFKPEFIDAFELGTKNTLLDGTMTLNGDIFYYKYQNYQISEIVDRTAINTNYNATVHGAELESTWEPLPGLQFNFAGGYEDGTIDNGQQAIDLMDRTAGTPGWMLVRPYVTQTSSCILPTAVVNELVAQGSTAVGCLDAYSLGLDPVTNAPYVANPDPINLPGYAGFNPATAPNSGEGFMKNLGGNKLPNMPPFTLSIGSQFSMPVTADWAATLRADFYWQGNTEARVFNDKPYDSIHGYTNLNLSVSLNSSDGWQAMFYAKNVFDVTAITGDFLNSDDTGLSTNVFLTDPRLFGVRVTKTFGEGDTHGAGGGFISDLADIFNVSDSDGGRPWLWVELGGQYAVLDDGEQRYAPPFASLLAATLTSPLPAQKLPGGAFDWNGKVSLEPDGSDWVFSASVRYGRSAGSGHVQKTPISQGGFATGDYVNSKSYELETHTILDFMVGKDVGLGMFGGTSVLNGGVRDVRFGSSQTTNILADPNYQAAGGPELFNSALQAKRGFHGIGPEISLGASVPVLGNPQNGEVSVDWGANAAVLFGRRTVDIHHQTSECQTHYHLCPTVYNTHATIHRSQQATIPNLGGFAAISMRYTNAKISFGYRADEFFGAMDGGVANSKDYNLGFFGPYANITIGIGG